MASTDVWYTPTREGYHMSEEEQAAIYLRLRKESKSIQNEIASLEADMKKAGSHFTELANSLRECRGAGIAWDVYGSLISGLPDKVERYQRLQAEKADIENQLGKFTGFD